MNQASFSTYPDVLTPNRAKEILQISRTVMYQLLRDGVIRSIRIGRNYRIPKQVLMDFIKSSCYTSIKKNKSADSSHQT